MRLNLNLGTSTSASIKLSLCGKGLLFYMIEARLSYMVETAKDLDVTLDDSAGLHK